MPRTALFAGSFDPYTIGHHSLVERALQMFDKVVIAVGCNSEKGGCTTVEERVANIAACYDGDSRVEVCSYSGLTMDFAREIGADVLLRGVRNIKDFEYEREQAEINRMIGGVETLLLYADPKLASISSSMVRELENFGRNIDEFLP